MESCIKIFIFAYLTNECLSAVIVNVKQNDIITNFKIDPWDPEKYGFEYDTSSGISRKENGYTKLSKDGTPIIAVKGFYSYVGDDSKTYRVEYDADENGYRPKISITGDSQKAINGIPHFLEATTPSSDEDNDLLDRVLPPGVAASLLGG